MTEMPPNSQCRRKQVPDLAGTAGSGRVRRIMRMPFQGAGSVAWNPGVPAGHGQRAWSACSRRPGHHSMSGLLFSIVLRFACRCRWMSPSRMRA